MRVLRDSTDAISIPKSFITQFMPHLSYNDLRIYLYLSCCNSLVEAKDLAWKLKISETDVLKSIRTMADIGLLAYDNRNIESAVTIKSNPILKLEKLSGEEKTFLEKMEEMKGSPLSRVETDDILYLKDALPFSDEVLYYIVSISMESSGFNRNYIKRIAFDYYENGVVTLEDAKKYRDSHNKLVREVFKHLGRKSVPTDSETSYIIAWKNTYHMPDDVILYACDKAVIDVDSNRLRYTSGILKVWNDNEVHDLESAKTFKLSRERVFKTTNPFATKTDSTIDFDELEKELLEN